VLGAKSTRTWKAPAARAGRNSQTHYLYYVTKQGERLRWADSYDGSRENIVDCFNAARDWLGMEKEKYVGERFIGSVRRECLDHVIVVMAAGLRRMLNEYVTPTREHERTSGFVLLFHVLWGASAKHTPFEVDALDHH
jgi:hypothetical protein